MPALEGDWSGRLGRRWPQRPPGWPLPGGASGPEDAPGPLPLTDPRARSRSCPGGPALPSILTGVPGAFSLRGAEFGDSRAPRVERVPPRRCVSEKVSVLQAAGELLRSLLAPNQVCSSRRLQPSWTGVGSGPGGAGALLPGPIRRRLVRPATGGRGLRAPRGPRPPLTTTRGSSQQLGSRESISLNEQLRILLRTPGAGAGGYPRWLGRRGCAPYLFYL